MNSRVERVIVDLPITGLPSLLTERFKGGKYGRLLKRLFNRSQPIWSKREGLASLDIEHR
jgi:hypothetical protein